MSEIERENLEETGVAESEVVETEIVVSDRDTETKPKKSFMDMFKKIIKIMALQRRRNHCLKKQR